MTAAGPWSVKGIDPKAREIAKDLARRSGMTLGEWLNQMIIDGDPPEGGDVDDDYRHPSRRTSDIYAAAPRTRREAPTEVEQDLSRLSRTLDQLVARLEAGEHRSTLAISGIDQSVMGVLSRIEAAERDQTALAARMETAMEEGRAGQARLADRLRKLEQEDGPRLEAMKAMESAVGRLANQLYESQTQAMGALGDVRDGVAGLTRRVDRLEAAPDAETVLAKVAERLDQAEARTTSAIRALELSFAALDRRLKTAEDRGGSGAGDPGRFEQLAAELSSRVEALRAEMAERLFEAAGLSGGRLDAALAQVTDHLAAVERRSAEAVERMGHEVMRIAQNLHGRMSGVEEKSEAAAQRLGADMARLEQGLEGRLRRLDQAQAEAVQRLGADIAGIAERMAQRVAESERRAAEAAGEAGQRVARVGDAMHQRFERASNELAERIRETEVRTARLLEEAQNTLERRLADADRRSALQAALEAAEAETRGRVAAPDPAPHPIPAEPPTPAFDDPFGPPAGGSNIAPVFVAAPDAAAPEAAEPFGLANPAPEVEGVDPFDLPPMPSAAAAAAPDPFEAPFGSAPAAGPDTAERGSQSTLSTRELIEQARAAARAAAASSEAKARGRRAQPASAPTPDDLRPVMAPASEGEGFRLDFGQRRPPKKEGVPLRTVLTGSGVAAALSIAMMGYVVLTGGEPSVEHAQPGEAVPVPPMAAADGSKSAPAAGAKPAQDASPLAAVALTDVAPQTPEPAASAPGSAPASAAPADSSPASEPKLLYSEAVRLIEGGDRAGVAPLKRAANLNYAPAQFYLAKLYEKGEAGLPKDPAEARRWTERAANAGEARAMHNMGLYAFEGDGGPRDVAAAAAWFQKAADLGVRDSQYNLARLYEKGFGVSQNPAEAYKWYLVAAASGDAEARSAADALRRTLPPETQAAAERSAQGLRARLAAQKSPDARG